MRSPDVWLFPTAKLKPGTIKAPLKKRRQAARDNIMSLLGWPRRVSHGTDTPFLAC